MTEKLIVALVIFAVGFGSGWGINDWRLGKQLAETQRDFATATAEASALREAKQKADRARNDAITDALVAEINAENTRSKVIIKEVIQYVQDPVADACPLPYGWLRLYDGSATGVLPPADGPAVAAAGRGEAITTVTALPVIADNNESCRLDKIRLQGWQDWWDGVVTP